MPKTGGDRTNGQRWKYQPSHVTSKMTVCAAEVQRISRGNGKKVKHKTAAGNRKKDGKRAIVRYSVLGGSRVLPREGPPVADRSQRRSSAACAPVS